MSGRTPSAGAVELGAPAAMDRNRLVEDNVPLARHLARRFAGAAGVSPDLLQAAMLGLVEAAERFDPDYGVPFAAFATKTILGELKRHRRDTGWRVHVSRRTKEVALRLGSAIVHLTNSLGRPPTPDEIAAHLGVSVELCLEAMEARRADRSVQGGEHGSEALLGAVTGPEPYFNSVEERDLIGRWLGRLSDLDRQMVVDYFWRERSQAEIARQLGVTQMTVSRSLARSLERMRAWSADERV